ncbi:ImmA/IrrE family metallo-endopeptidase [uncultured Aliiroseovarius sp.]|uniref:ImmA/IrrE family metallo-endopeptidase n=1 Tax=uncultured Aliiroseovarius sp. TaxID=1658783 RepID=UPI0026127C1F|nr:ImmA/IrrE family metallo-endopeptidase [uncultured Aliiroseovarius sp.]
MSKFRLMMARRQGELKAKEMGFDCFPVDPFAIAEAEDIMVEPKPPDQVGVSGGIIFYGNDVGIFYATNIDSDGFRRFTVAHELGHYFLDGHPEEIQKTAPIHISKAGFSEGSSSIELEADHFASGLLMPSRLVSNVIGTSRAGLDAIINLGDRAECSLTASAIRAAECCDYPMAVIVSSGDKVAYAFLSDSFKKLDKLTFLRKGAPLPDSLTREFNRKPNNIASGQTECGQTTLANWFSCTRRLPLDEEVVGLGSYGFALTVLSSDQIAGDPDDEELAEEEALIESWTPRFARGR